LLALEDAALFDCVSYFAGVSGSTWAAASLSFRGLNKSTIAFKEGWSMEGIGLEGLVEFVTALQEETDAGAKASIVVDLWGFLIAHQVVLNGLDSPGTVPMYGKDFLAQNFSVPVPIFSLMQVHSTQLGSPFGF
jgi:hypothetical protein